MNRLGQWFGLVALLAFVGPVSSLATEYQSAAEALEKGKALLDKGELDSAIFAFTEAIRLDPKNALTYCNRGFAQCRKGHVERAIPGYDKAIRLNRKEAESQSWDHERYDRMPILGPIRPGGCDAGLDPPSENEVLRALKKAKDDPLHREVQRKDVRMVVEPIADYVDPPRMYPLVGQARCHHTHYRCEVKCIEVTGVGSRDKEKEEEAQEVVYIDHDHLHMVVDAALDKAITDFTEAIRLNPKLAEAYGGRGLAHGYKAEYVTALADCTAAIWLDPKSAEAYCGRGMVHYLKGDDDKAIADFTEAIRLDPKPAEAYYDRGMAYLMKSNYDKAIADYTEAIRLNPKHAEAFYARGYAYWWTNVDYSKAEADFAQAKSLGYKPE